MPTLAIDWKAVGDAITQHLIDNRLSVERAANDIGVGRKTLDRVMRGEKVNLRTLGLIEKWMGCKFVHANHSETSATSHRWHVPECTPEIAKSYIGKYYSFRYSFDYAGRVICAHTRIMWDEASSRLRFHEEQRNRDRSGEIHNYAFDGFACIYKDVGVVQLVADTPSLKRVINLKPNLINENAVMRGVLLTINEIRDVGFLPAATSVVYFKDVEGSAETPNDTRVGSFDREEVWKKEALKELDSAAHKFFAPAHSV